MTLFEINLEKPALVEERAYSTGTSSADATDESMDDADSSSGRSFGFKRLFGLLLVVAAVVAVRKLRSATSSTADDASEPESTAGPSKAARAIGILGTVVACVVLVRRVFGGASSE